MIWTVALLTLLVSHVNSEDFCYNEPRCGSTSCYWSFRSHQAIFHSRCSELDGKLWNSYSVAFVLQLPDAFPRKNFQCHLGCFALRPNLRCGPRVSCSPSSDPYGWADAFPSCHPLLERRHSPINLDHQMTRDGSLGSLHLEGFDATQPGHWTLQNDGHSVVLRVGSGLSVSGGGLPDVYHTIQLHFHWGGPAANGSEHTVDGRRYPMEMHIVNVKSIHPNMTAALDDPTGLAVLGFFIDVVYADNVHFVPISQKLSSVAYKGQATKVKPFPLMSLLPKHNMSQYYRYHGSLTAPPCSQAVVWTLYEVPVYISWSQLAQFTSQIFSTAEDAEQVTPLQNNFRHIHPTFSRVVSASKDASLLTGTAGRPLGSAVSLRLLQVVLLGGFTLA